MRRKPDDGGGDGGSSPVRDLQRELERLGLAPDAAGPLAGTLARLARQLPEREAGRLIEGLAGTPGRADAGASAPELRNILEDFASELKKLDEGLRLLTAYLVRLKDQTTGASRSARTLH